MTKKAFKISKKEIKEFEKVIKGHQWNSGEPYCVDDVEMEEMFAADRRSLTSLLSACIEENWKAADKISRRMDTACREEIPSSIWNKLIANFRD